MNFPFININLPIVNPVYVFSIVMLTLLLMPILMKKLKLPELIGLIFAGIILGPEGLHILENNSSIVLFGTVGIIYIMFYSGLEIDINDFKKKSHKSFIFGMLTFLLPQILGTITTYKFIGLNLVASILLASMYASHTLLSYPIVSKFGVKKDESVLVTIGGTLVTNSISLIILAVIVSSVGGELNLLFWIKLLILSAVFIGFTMFFIPKIASWFFKNAQGEGISHFIFVMAVVFVISSLSKGVGLEPIIGAFLAGLAINSLIPSNSVLMNRIDFVGNALFIPFFLIYVGMLVDLKIFITSPKTIIVTIVMTVTATLTKWLAAFLSQRILGYSKIQRNIIFGLSNAQAANTLAAVLVGYNLKIFDIYILNGTIGMILFTCLISAIVTEKYAKKLALNNSNNTHKHEDLIIEEKILVPLHNPNTLGNLVDLAVLIKSSQSNHPIYPLIIVSDSEYAAEELKEKQKLLTEASIYAAGSSNVTKLISRIDVNPASGIIRVGKELGISHTVIGWNGQLTKGARIFGTTLDHILDGSSNILFVTKVCLSWNIMKRVILILPENAEIEKGFTNVITSISYLVNRIKASLLVLGTEKQVNIIKDVHAKLEINLAISRNEITNIEEFIETSIEQFDLPILYSGRKQSLIWSSKWDGITNKLSRTLISSNFIIVYSQVEEKNDNIILIH